LYPTTYTGAPQSPPGSIQGIPAEDLPHFCQLFLDEGWHGGEAILSRIMGKPAQAGPTVRVDTGKKGIVYIVIPSTKGLAAVAVEQSGDVDDSESEG